MFSNRQQIIFRGEDLVKMSNHTLSDVQEGKDYSFPLQVLYLLPYLLLRGLNES